MTREEILAEATHLTTGDRNVSYGHPYTNLTHMADMATAYLNGKYGFSASLTAEDMAWIMVLAKISRAAVSYKEDNFVDGAAYCAIAGECAEITEKNAGRFKSTD